MTRAVRKGFSAGRNCWFVFFFQRAALFVIRWERYSSRVLDGVGTASVKEVAVFFPAFEPDVLRQHRMSPLSPQTCGCRLLAVARCHQSRRARLRRECRVSGRSGCEIRADPYSSISYPAHAEARGRGT